MKNVPMRFDGFCFTHNPAKLKIEDTDNIVAILSPFDVPDSLRLGRRLRVIRGEGELYSADCIEQYNTLYTLYAQGHRGLLSLPHMAPMTAYLKELGLIAEPREDVLTFSFSFIEAKGDSTPVSACDHYTVTEQGESLWDIAYRFHKGIDTLVELNPQIRYIDALNAGERVKLC